MLTFQCDSAACEHLLLEVLRPRFEDMDYDTVISSAETTIGMVEAIRRSLAEQAGGFQPFHIFQPVAHNCMALRPRIVVWTCQAGIQPDQIRVRLSKTPLTACRSYGLYSYWLFRKELHDDPWHAQQVTLAPGSVKVKISCAAHALRYLYWKWKQEPFPTSNSS